MKERWLPVMYERWRKEAGWVHRGGGGYRKREKTDSKTG